MSLSYSLEHECEELMSNPDMVEELKRAFGSAGYEIENINVDDVSESEQSQTG